MFQYLLQGPGSFVHLYLFTGILRLIYFIFITVSVIIIMFMISHCFFLFVHTRRNCAFYYDCRIDYIYRNVMKYKKHNEGSKQEGFFFVFFVFTAKRRFPSCEVLTQLFCFLSDKKSLCLIPFQCFPVSLCRVSLLSSDMVFHRFGHCGSVGIRFVTTYVKTISCKAS